jgi:hypothetical protein
MEIVRPGRKLKYSNWEANVVCKLWSDRKIELIDSLSKAKRMQEPVSFLEIYAWTLVLRWSTFQFNFKTIKQKDFSIKLIKPFTMEAKL